MGEEPPTYANMANRNRQKPTNMKFEMPKQELTVSTSMKNFKDVANMNTDRIVKALQSIRVAHQLHTIQINQGRCEITFKNKNSKEKIMKDGITIDQTRIQFGDDSKRVFNVTICGLPAEFEGKKIIYEFSQFGDIGNSYYPIHKTGETVWRNGNLVIQFNSICKPLPKFFFVGHRKVKVVFSKIPDYFKTQDFEEEDDWGADAILEAPGDVDELARGDTDTSPTPSDNPLNRDAQADDDAMETTTTPTDVSSAMPLPSTTINSQHPPTQPNAPSATQAISSPAKPSSSKTAQPTQTVTSIDQLAHPTNNHSITQNDNRSSAGKISTKKNRHRHSFYTTTVLKKPTSELRAEKFDIIITKDSIDRLQKHITSEEASNTATDLINQYLTTFYINPNISDTLISPST